MDANIRIKCQANLSKDFLRTIKDQDRKFCKRNSEYKINNKCLCRMHASLLALQLLFNQNLVEKL